MINKYKTLHESNISFETAKLAKEKGFTGIVRGIYDTDGNYMDSIETNEHYTKWASAPTQSLLQKWLRDEHDIHVHVEYFHDPKFGYHHKYDSVISHEGNDWDGGIENRLKRIESDEFRMYRLFDTYEEALEDGLHQSLKLIEI